MSKCIRLSISILAFLIGWAFSASFRPTLMLAFLIAVSVTLFIVGSVPYQVLTHRCEWRAALGKALLAGLLWALATAMFLPFGIFLFVTSTDIPDPHGPPLKGQLIYLTLVATYCLGGAAICRRVSGGGQGASLLCGGERVP